FFADTPSALRLRSGRLIENSPRAASRMRDPPTPYFRRPRTRRSDQTWAEMSRRVVEAPTEDFASLVKIAGLDPQTELRFGDFAGVSFRGTDLRGFDLSGANLRGCDFVDANLVGACFQGARIDGARFPVGSIESFLAGAIFQDAPLAPEMVIVPAGE